MCQHTSKSRCITTKVVVVVKCSLAASKAALFYISIIVLLIVTSSILISIDVDAAVVADVVVGVALRCRCDGVKAGVFFRMRTLVNL